jgi:hypothetical protein
MTLDLPKTISDNDRYAAWVRVIKRIYMEQDKQAWNCKIFHLVRTVFNTNDDLSKHGGFIFNWIAENYVDASLMVIRRELDKEDRVENIKNLLYDIQKHPEVLSRTNYIAPWPAELHNQANKIFDSYNPITIPGNPDADHINPQDVKSELSKLNKEFERLRIYAERTRAHRTSQNGIDTSIKFRELHKAISDIRSAIEKYCRLLTPDLVIDWDATPLYDIIGPFTKPWVMDRAIILKEFEGKEKSEK